MPAPSCTRWSAAGRKRRREFAAALRLPQMDAVARRGPGRSRRRHRHPGHAQRPARGAGDPLPGGRQAHPDRDPDRDEPRRGRARGRRRRAERQGLWPQPSHALSAASAKRCSPAPVPARSASATSPAGSSSSGSINVGATGYRRSWTDNILWHHFCHFVDLGMYLFDGAPIRRVQSHYGPCHELARISHRRQFRRQPDLGWAARQAWAGGGVGLARDWSARSAATRGQRRVE